MTEYSWAALYDRACDLFRDRPNADQEQTILDAFRDRPRFVSEQVDKIASGVTNGTIRSGWAVLRQTVSAPGPVDARVTDSSERDKRVRATLNWISNAGLHFDREPELVDELFGDTGRLRAWADDDSLCSSMVAAWQKVRTEPQRLPGGVRPPGEELERLDSEYFAWLNASRRRLAELEVAHARALRDELDAKQEVRT